MYYSFLYLMFVVIGAISHFACKVNCTTILVQQMLLFLGTHTVSQSSNGLATFPNIFPKDTESFNNKMKRSSATQLVYLLLSKMFFLDKNYRDHFKVLHSFLFILLILNYI